MQETEVEEIVNDHDSILLRPEQELVRIAGMSELLGPCGSCGMAEGD